MQVAITGALASSFTKHKPLFASLQYQTLTQQDDITSLTRKFPYDVDFLPSHVLDTMVSKSIQYNTEFWPIERIRAYQGNDICAKRAAVTPFLWERYSEYGDMTLTILEKWCKVEVLQQLLTMPTWFKNQHVSEENIMMLWVEKLGEKKAEYEREHALLLAEIQGMM